MRVRREYIPPIAGPTAPHCGSKPRSLQDGRKAAQERPNWITFNYWSTLYRCGVRTMTFCLVTLAVAGFYLATRADEIQHLSIPLPGGQPGLPVMGPAQPTSNGVSITWFGPSGYYQLLQKTNLKTSGWTPVGGLRLTNQAILSTDRPGCFYSVSGPSAVYATSHACLECHPGTHADVMHTAHIGAFTNHSFVMQGGQTNTSCLVCHTSGYGVLTGFSETNRNGVLSFTAELAGVQCENCHGPAGRHAANPGDFTVRPRIEVAAALCGGCHNSQSVPASVSSSHPPYYENWNTSAHRAVSATVRANLSASPANVAECGRCHSGTVRESLLEDTPLPGAPDAGSVGVACVACHDPHENTVYTNVLAGVQPFRNNLTGLSYVFTNNILGYTYTNQLRGPLASLKDFHAAGLFATNHDAGINVCAQCHNDRGASYLDTGAPPHRSAQYNILLGTTGEMMDGVPPAFPAGHSRIEKQCAACHMQTPGGQSGHAFTVASYEICANCHGTAASAQNFAGFLKQVIQSMSAEVKRGLDEWAATKSPAQIRPYGTLGWEYETAGQLSSLDGTGHGPAHGDQQYIPVGIQKARFNLYLVANDGSFGLHNGPFAITLLQAAQNWVNAELKPNGGN